MSPYGACDCAFPERDAYDALLDGIEEADADVPPYAEQVAFLYETASVSEVARVESAREQAERRLRSGRPLSAWTIRALRSEIRLSDEFGVSPWLLAYSEAIHEHDPELWRDIASGKGDARRSAQRANRALRPLRSWAAPRSCRARARRTVQRRLALVRGGLLLHLALGLRTHRTADHPSHPRGGSTLTTNT